MAARSKQAKVRRRKRTYVTAKTADKEPKWRVKGSELRTGYEKTW